MPGGHSVLWASTRWPSLAFAAKTSWTRSSPGPTCAAVMCMATMAGGVVATPRWRRSVRRESAPCAGTRGPYVPLWLGCEAGFYVDAEPPTHAFVPCGHVCSEKTTAYWSEISLPHGTHTFHAACPFCIQPLSGETGCIRLIFQSPLD
ncbi:E3 ubiquitin-protein ligase pellino-like protein 1 [Larimichthys crocea]|uniref:Uncharacterized protein n=1 Tax=Larimichthys crocea TaxID=215358 RepID=A0ACD3RXZ6_LARCR|nr:E3 ubiquitin-protein ligase pellino-like protein 1 [Larimichthys crocea]